MLKNPDKSIALLIFYPTEFAARLTIEISLGRAAISRSILPNSSIAPMAIGEFSRKKIAGLCSYSGID
ncbi:hypothetical protein [Lyngbya sp. CCAP 1446/10]|uniref:hypothetical protein n=1 Tax=Lyngbya sp. CCAP 1446/10 TaxID=439293 RepID=UPI0022384FF6|nr:hypothetical protein [Lyngbya sp. CCAP 1446/10]